MQLGDATLTLLAALGDNGIIIVQLHFTALIVPILQVLVSVVIYEFALFSRSSKVIPILQPRSTRPKSPLSQTNHPTKAPIESDLPFGVCNASDRDLFISVVIDQRMGVRVEDTDLADLSAGRSRPVIGADEPVTGVEMRAWRRVV